MSPADYRWRVDRGLSQLQGAVGRVREEKRARVGLLAHLRALLEAQGIAQVVAEAVQTQAHERIAQTVTKCLAVFDEPYEFHIRFRRARGRTEARLTFSREGLEVDPVEGSGLGVVDVAAFALRLACLVLRRPRLRRVLLLDEPFRFVSAEYRPRLRALLASLSEELGVQVVMVTHDRELRVGRVVSLE